MRIAVISAMEEENHLLLHQLGLPRKAEERGLRTYYLGKLFGIETVLACSRWGKVAAAATTTHLIVKYGVDAVIFTGVAGAVDPHLRIGDIVLAKSLVQHDLDPRPLFNRFEVPFLGETYFQPDGELFEKTRHAIKLFLQEFKNVIPPALRQEFQLEPRLIEGMIASGDRFFADKEGAEQLRCLLPESSCVEMEGAAVAQVCYEYDVPLVVVRTISDAAGNSAHIDFQRFISKVASHYAVGILQHLFPSLTALTNV